MGSAEKRQLQISVRRIEQEVAKLKAAARERREREVAVAVAAAARVADEEEAVRILEEHLAAGANGDATQPSMSYPEAGTEPLPTVTLVSHASQHQIESPEAPVEGANPPADTTEPPAVSVSEVESEVKLEEDGDSESEAGIECCEAEHVPARFPDFLCPSSEEKSRQHEVRLWLRKTTYSKAPGFLPWQ